jgi:dethiobiotin synthetase
LNSFNLSYDRNTILHAAAKSNNVKMLEFVLQRISPNTKKRMMKMKNKQEQLPSDLVIHESTDNKKKKTKARRELTEQSLLAATQASKTFVAFTR